MKTVTIDQFLADLKMQDAASNEHLVFKCPMCGTLQSAHDLINAGAGETFEDVKKYIGFSCIGRWTGAEGPRSKPDGLPCNWTLGGLLTLHSYEVKTTDGKTHPHFEPATPDEYLAHQSKAALATS
ncbi:VVA0879 family protein [Shimia sp.]|uniref:VVA0879 family protein n=1 Tax=Shimia sp. TaxID=1954381 RepID=UPI003BABC85F